MDIIYKCPTCMHCGKSARVTLDKSDVDRWKDGAYVQTVWPDMTPEDRETLISGFHPECFAAIFGGDDE